MKRATHKQTGPKHTIRRVAPHTGPSLFGRITGAPPRHRILPLHGRQITDRAESYALRIAIAMAGIIAVQIAVAFWRGVL